MSDSTAGSGQKAAGSGFISNSTQVHCPACDSVIAREAVAANIRTKDYGETKQDLKAYCDHCDKLFVAVCILRGGMWHPEGQPVEATEQQRKSFMKRLDHLRGNRLAEAVAG